MTSLLRLTRAPPVPHRCPATPFNPCTHAMALLLRLAPPSVTMSEPARRRIVPPRSTALRLVVKNDTELAPGLEVRAELSYLSDSVVPLDDQLLIQVGSREGAGETELLTIPIVVRPRLVQSGA